jgi:hypothetical protein
LKLLVVVAVLLGLRQVPVAGDQVEAHTQKL